jgi:hypothetical protein
LANSASDSRSAGRSIASAYQYLKGSFGELATLLRTADAQLAGFSPNWKSLSSAVTWERSASLANPEQWIPRFFRRFWYESPGSKVPAAAWNRALALDIWVEVERETHGTDEPWIGCYAFRALEPNGLEGWQPEWIASIASAEYDMKWAPGYENRAFDWSSLREMQESQRFQVCGYFLRLTDVQSAADVSKMITEPLVALASGWNVEKLPQPLPDWSFAKE